MKNYRVTDAHWTHEFDLHDLCYRLFYPSKEEVAKKVKELEAHGQTEPIEVYKKTVMHGHSLFLGAEKICLEHVEVVYPEKWIDSALLGLRLIAREVEAKTSSPWPAESKNQAVSLAISSMNQHSELGDAAFLRPQSNGGGASTDISLSISAPPHSGGSPFVATTESRDRSTWNTP